MPEQSFTIVKLFSAIQIVKIDVDCLAELSFTIVKLFSAVQVVIIDVD